MSTQVENGRAFEWAIGRELSKQTGCEIEPSDSSKLAQNCFDLKISVSKKKIFNSAAVLAISHILKKEKTGLTKSFENGLVKFNSDKAGAAGDVRDVMLVLPQGVLGISCKNNHSALKHSRLSSKLDFIAKWGINEKGCSAEYFSTMDKIFGELKRIRQKSKGAALWEDIEDKADRFYWPVLNAWADEITKIAKHGDNEANLCKAMISYLVGKHDFYKVICEGSTKVQIQAWNFNGSLSTQKTKHPTCINAINKKNGGQYSKTIVFNHGYSLNFRIHSASSKVEASLKFDITAIGLPTKQVEQQTLYIEV